jgi:anti-sigma factor RsiW
MNCERATEMLGAWMDGEVAASELRELEEHLDQCAACSREKARIERLEGALKGAFAARATDLAFAPFWEGVQKRIAAEAPRQRRLSEWITDALAPRSLAWVVPLILVFAIGLFSVRQFFPGWLWGTAVANLTFVESIDPHGGNVALFRESETRTTVIWLYPNQEGEDESSQEATGTDNPF